MYSFMQFISVQTILNKLGYMYKNGYIEKTTRLNGRLGNTVDRFSSVGVMSPHFCYLAFSYVPRPPDFGLLRDFFTSRFVKTT